MFEVIDSCHYNHFEKYCPVLVKLGTNYRKEDDIHLRGKGKELVSDDTHNHRLEVWQKGGHLVFQRNLSNKLLNWNIFGNTFVF